MKKENEKKCAFCSTPRFERNKYYYGKLMTADDYRLEQCYFNKKRWLINKMTIGTGVVCGLKVVRDPDDSAKIIVEKGMAIDSCGREILVCENIPVELKPEEDPCRSSNGQADQDTPQLLDICIEFRECETHQVKIKPAICDRDDPYEFNHIRDSFQIHVHFRQEGENGDSLKPHCPLDEKFEYQPPIGESEDEEYEELDNGRKDIPGESTGEGQEQEPGQIEGKTLQQYLCEQISSGCPDSPHSPCVHLATVTAALNEDGYYTVSGDGAIDNCGDNSRQLVYSNALLYDLIDCYHGELPHIIGINWWGRHGREDVQWSSFEELVTDGFEITFDREMESTTINRFTFLFSIITTGTKAGYRKREYIYPEPDEVTTEDNKTFIITPDVKWIKDEVEKGGYSALRNEKELGFDVEIILRGSHIMSTNGKALDGDFIGGKLPSGNGTQGGDFISWFHVLPPEPERSPSTGSRKKSKKID